MTALSGVLEVAAFRWNQAGVPLGFLVARNVDLVLRQSVAWRLGGRELAAESPTSEQKQPYQSAT